MMCTLIIIQLNFIYYLLFINLYDLYDLIKHLKRLKIINFIKKIFFLFLYFTYKLLTYSNIITIYNTLMYKSLNIIFNF